MRFNLQSERFQKYFCPAVRTGMFWLEACLAWGVCEVRCFHSKPLHVLLEQHNWQQILLSTLPNFPTHLCLARSQHSHIVAADIALPISVTRYLQTSFNFRTHAFSHLHRTYSSCHCPPSRSKWTVSLPFFSSTYLCDYICLQLTLRISFLSPIYQSFGIICSDITSYMFSRTAVIIALRFRLLFVLININI